MASLTVNLPNAGPVVDVLVALAEREGIDVPASGAERQAALTLWLRNHLRALYIGYARHAGQEAALVEHETQLLEDADAIT